MPTDPTPIHLTVLNQQHRALSYKANPSADEVRLALERLDLQHNRLIIVTSDGQLEVSIADEACQRVFIFYAGRLGQAPTAPETMAHLTDPTADPHQRFPFVSDTRDGLISMVDTVPRAKALAVALAFMQEKRLLDDAHWSAHG